MDKSRYGGQPSPGGQARAKDGGPDFHQVEPTDELAASAPARSIGLQNLDPRFKSGGASKFLQKLALFVLRPYAQGLAESPGMFLRSAARLALLSGEELMKELNGHGAFTDR